MKVTIQIEYDTESQMVTQIKEAERNEPAYFKGPNPILAALSEAVDLLKFNVNLQRVAMAQQAAMQQAQNAAITNAVKNGHGRLQL